MSLVGPRPRRPYPPSLHLTKADLERMRAAVLIPTATGKCLKCGSTLVADPLPHLCNPSDAPVSKDHWKYAP